MAQMRRPGGHRARSLRHLRQRRPELRPAVRAAPSAEAQMVQLRLQRPARQLRRATRQAAGRRRPPPRPGERHRNHHARDQPRAIGRSPAAAGRGDAQRGAAVRRRLLHCAGQRAGRDGDCPRSDGPAAAVLRDRRAAVGRGQRERRPVESRLLASQHPFARAGRDDLRQRQRVPPGAIRRQLRGGLTASSSGFISPTWPARSTAAASICRARPWARNSRGSKTLDDRREHGRRARARYEQVRGRRDGLPAGRAQRRRVDSQPLLRPHVHRRRRQPHVEGPVEVHAAPRGARRQAGAAGGRFDRPLDDDARADLADSRSGQGPRDSRPRRLPADRGTLLLRHRHVDDFASCSRRGSSARTGRWKKTSPRWPATWAPIRSAICRSSRSPEAVDRPPSELCRACITGDYPDARTASSSTKSRWQTPAMAPRRRPTAAATRRTYEARGARV